MKAINNVVRGAWDWRLAILIVGGAWVVGEILTAAHSYFLVTV